MNRNGQSSWRSTLLPMLLLSLWLLAAEVVAADDQVSATSNSLSSNVAGIRAFLDDLFRVDQNENKIQTGRTFGQKRIQFMLMPMVYKMGVMMTMLAVLTVISLKGLAIGLILLVLKLSAVFGKLYATFHSHGWQYGHPASSWTAPQPPVHVHLHNSGPHGQAYNAWDSAAPAPPPDESYYYKG